MTGLSVEMSRLRRRMSVPPSCGLLASIGGTADADATGFSPRSHARQRSIRSATRGRSLTPAIIQMADCSLLRRGRGHVVMRIHRAYDDKLAVDLFAIEAERFVAR